ncbi:MAG: trigger factor [Alphaproteobacteria bacterium]|nr:trigger factor [Alphaproteobacteria bacterium]
MQVTEISNDGLKREFKVTIQSSDIQTKVDHRLEELGRTVNLPGFRPGKVPMPVLRKRFGTSVMGEVLERAVSDSSYQAMGERGLRPAMQPKIEITSFAEGKDLEYKMAVELLPEIKPMDFKELTLERLKVEPSEAEVTKAIERLAEAGRQTEKVSEDRATAKGDVLLIDFVGKVDGKEFAGGAAKDHKLELGSNQFIAGFEDQLIGHKPGTTTDINVTFPKEYGNAELAGKPAVFTVTVREIHRKLPVTVDEALAKKIGFEDLPSLRKAVGEQIGKEFARAARARLKRQLLDKLAEKHSFTVPQGMVDIEFENIWKSVEEARKRGDDDPTIKGKSDDQLKADFKGISERRVRLGLLLSEVGRVNNLQVSEEEVNRSLIEEARRFPGQERKIIEYYRSQPEALAQLRAPLFEDKVVDFILEMASVTEKSVTPEELTRDDDEAKA